MQERLIHEFDGEITALHNVDDDLFLGNNKGEIIKFRIKPLSGNDPTFEIIEISRTTISSKRLGFKVPFRHTKGVEKILSDKINQLLFIQVNNALYIYDFSLSKMLYVVKESKNLTTFTLDEQSGSGVMRQCIILMAVNDRLHFVHYSPMSYRIIKEDTLQFPEKVSIVKWYRSTVVIGFKSKKKYVKIDLKSNRHKSEHIIDCDSPYLVLIDHEILLRLKETVVTINLQQGNEHFGMMGRGTVHFTFEPAEIATMFPYIVGMRASEKKNTEGLIEIRTLYDRDFMDQKILGRNGKLFTTNNTKNLGIFYSENTEKSRGKMSTRLFILVPIPPERQIEMLLEKGNTKEVFELFEKTFEGDGEEKRKKKVDLILKSGFVALFYGDIPKAFKYFGDGEALPHYDIREILFFFKERIPHLFMNQFERKFNLDKTESLEMILKDTYFERSIAKKKGDGPQSSLALSNEGDIRKRVQARMDSAEEELLKLCHEKRDPNNNSQEEVIIDNTIVVLSDYENTEVFLRGKNNCSVSEMREELQKRQNPILYPLLLKSKARFDEALRELESVNSNMGVDTYWQEKVVREASSILRTEKLKFEDVFFRHLSWIYKAGIEKMKSGESKRESGPDYYKFFLNEGMKVFKQTPTTLTPARVMEFFSSHLEKYPSVYEKYLLNFLESKINNNDETELYHNELATLYIDLIEIELKSHNDDLFSGGGAMSKAQLSLILGKESGNIGRYRQRLFSFLEHSNKYNFRTVLQRLDETQLYNEQCVVHKKLGQHEKALEILVCKLKNLRDAEKYCTGFSSDSQFKSDIKFVEHHKQLKSKQLSALLRICFRQKRVMLMPTSSTRVSHKSELNLVKFAVQMLNKYSRFFDLSEALELIPDEVKISQLAPFFEESLQYYVSVKRRNRIGANLWKTNYVDHKFRLYNLQSRYFIHNHHLTCKKCKKKITSAICVYPNFEIVHYNCRNKRNDSVDTVNQRNFIVHPISK